MARKIKQTLDVSQLFNHALVNPQQQAEIIRSEAWPIIVSVYSVLEGDLLVHRMSNGIIHMSNKAGITVAALYKNADNYNFMLADSPFATHSADSTTYYSTHLISKHPKYIASKLRNNTELRERLLQQSSEAVQNLNRALRSITDVVVDKFAGRSISGPSVSLQNVNGLYALKVLMGECSVHDIPKNVYEDLDAAYKSYRKEQDALSAAVEKAKDFFATDKFVYSPKYNGGVLLGAISSQPMLAALDTYLSSGSLPGNTYHTSYSYIDMTLPFKWYPSVQDIPDPVRSQLETSLLMFIAHTGRDKMADGGDRTGRDTVYPDINAFCWGNYNYNDMLILER